LNKTLFRKIHQLCNFFVEQTMKSEVVVYNIFEKKVCNGGSYAMQWWFFYQFNSFDYKCRIVLNRVLVLVVSSCILLREVHSYNDFTSALQTRKTVMNFTYEFVVSSLFSVLKLVLLLFSHVRLSFSFFCKYIFY